jgi:hypothetical protein
MARQVGFHVYSVKVRERYQRKTEILSNLCQRYDFLDVLNEGMNNILHSQNTDKSAERVACLKRVEVSGRHLIGLLEAGHYGESADIVNAQTRRVVHVQGTQEAALLPCFFRLVIPVGNERGLLILQRDNRVQSKGALMSVLNPILSSLSPDLACQVEPIMNRQTFERLVGNGQIQQLKFIRYSITQDFADEYDHGRDQTEGSMELTVKARRGKSLPMKDRIAGWMNSSGSISDMFEIPGLEGFDFETVKADLRIGNRKQTVDFGKKLTNPVIDLSDKIMWQGGRPTWSSLVAATNDLAQDEMFDMEGGNRDTQ